MQCIDPGYKNEDGTLTSFVADSTGKGNYTGKLEKTGSSQEYIIKNIYDIAGNVSEWTMEKRIDEAERVRRGGNYADKGNQGSASVRGSRDSSQVGDGYGFSITLYLNVEENWSPTYDEEGTYKDKNGDTAYIPKGFKVSQVNGENAVDDGLVIRNATTDDRYVWIEVPKSIYTTATSETDYENIEKDMQTYTAEYKEGYEGYSDTWYSGCGISSEEEYNNLKNQMLTSVYNNGGFYISQYEIGADSYVTANDNGARTPVSKEGMYPYNYVTVAQAQQLATNMDSGEKTSSLMFGIQWDLVLKFLEAKGVSTTELKNDSSSWGNYSNAEFVVKESGEYSKYNKSTSIFEEWNDIPENYTKPSSGSENMVLLMTGIVDRNSKLNIYDLAGNSWEFTLEKNGNEDRRVCVSRGGDCNRIGLEYAASYRDKITTAWYWGGLGFRSTLY